MLDKAAYGIDSDRDRCENPLMSKAIVRAEIERFLRSPSPKVLCISGPEGSPLWRCVMLWQRQGKRSESFGAAGYLRTAIFDEPPIGTYTVDHRGLILQIRRA
ncbi:MULTISPECIES: hypothetical protein [Sphingomonas]|jgi:hypothetical protein|uniref:hypothetical protein n=1 Tax=Sphingomonas TaxID=13687 RepID=UPI002413517C|nr:hypothetical protein [Sphingomonas echinoides]